MNRVLMVGPKSFPPSIGGIETHVHEISKRLTKKGWNITVAVPRNRGEQRRESLDGVRVLRLPALRNRYAIKLSLIPSLINEIKKGSYDIVHAHDATGGFSASVAANHDTFVYTMHGLASHPRDWPSPFRQGIGLMQDKAIRAATHVFCTDQLAAREVRRIRTQVEVISNGVDADLFSKERWCRPTEYVGESFRFIFVGRLAKVKGVEYLLDAITKIPPEIRSCMRFEFIGDGPLKEAVTSASRRLPEVRYIGSIDHGAIPPYYAHADAFVLPSLSEGIPLSLLEAMAANLPCIATNVGGIPSQIHRDAFLGIPPSDTMALTDAMVRLYEHRTDSRAMAERARRLVVERFSWDGVCERIASTYERVLASRAA